MTPQLIGAFATRIAIRYSHPLNDLSLNNQERLGQQFPASPDR
jgi:hypothetical protein